MRKVKSLKITTLAENLVQSSGFHGQWGLSFLLELEDSLGRLRKVVFDTGNDKQPLMHNVEHLKVELSELDCIILSHGHGDHTAAIVEFVQAAGGVKVFAHPHVFLPRFYEDKQGKRRRGGVPRGESIADIEAAGGQVYLSTEPEEVVPGLWTTGEISRQTPFEKVSPPLGGGRRILVFEGEEVDDQIMDDQALWMDVETGGPFIVTGCAHAGVVNTLLRIQELSGFKKMYGLMGGTHLVGRSGSYLEETVKNFRSFKPSIISPCHCTGFKATVRLWRAFPEEFVLNFCGRVIEAGKKLEDRLV